MTARALEPYGTSIFAEMTRLANEHNALNLAQGFEACLAAARPAEPSATSSPIAPGRERPSSALTQKSAFRIDA